MRGRALVASARPQGGGDADRNEAPRAGGRASHVLLGWRRLEAPLIAQVLAAAAGEGPLLAPAEATLRYRSQPPARRLTHLLGEA